MDYERQTEELILPDAEAKMVLYANMTNGDFRKIQRAMISKTKVTLDPADPTKSKVQDISGEIIMDQEEAVLSCLLVSVANKEGEEVGNVDKFIYNLSMSDGKLLFDKLNDISASSSMGDSKKKSN